MQALHVTLIVTRGSEIVETTHVRDETTFPDVATALAYNTACQEWMNARPFPDDPRSWSPPERIVYVERAHDEATELAARLPTIILPRDSAVFPDTDPEAVAAAAEHRPYDFATT